MDVFTVQPRLIVKLAVAPSFALEPNGALPKLKGFTLEPLFDGAIASPQNVGFGAAPRADWYALTRDAGVEVNAWDLCHRLVSGEEEFAAAVPGGVIFAEPDLAQRWLPDEAAMATFAMTGCPAKGKPSNLNQPPCNDNDHLWFQNAEHSQLGAAGDPAGGPAGGRGTRIAHLDTGYDPGHITRPAHLRTDLATNYVDPEFPNDATDRTEGGPLTNLGHGTGTLGILAGSPYAEGPLGGAPQAEVVPIRVANSVVLFYNSAIVRGFTRVLELCASGDASKAIDVVTMSMGGLASQAWAEKVNALYEAGVFVVTAAGNNFGNLPTAHIVYPARFGRVVAACGIRADGSPYADLPLNEMAGNYGPASKMTTAMAGYSPNIPWAHLGCERLVDFNGQGTSAATPQIAAAAALWIGSNRSALGGYSERWMRVEAVRKALFDSAATPGTPALQARLGHGGLRAVAALGQVPPTEDVLRPLKQRPDSASFPLWRVLTGLGAAAPANGRQQMLELEALQLSQRSKELGELVERESDPATASAAQRARIIELLMSSPGASTALRSALSPFRTQTPGAPKPAQVPASAAAMQAMQAVISRQPPLPETRSLRVFAFDPLTGTSQSTYQLNETTLEVCWEPLQSGPVGDYLEVIDIDPANQVCFAPVDLNHPSVLAQQGLTPSEAVPQFHQQMVYAVAMRTIAHFEHALGRVALWAPRRVGTGDNLREIFVRRLRIYPHALQEANSYYSPDKKALLFGYFQAQAMNAGANLPGGIVFCCLSHDVVAHETAHALLDGLHRRFREASNPDVLAFHEGFADLVALFQHFALPDALRYQLATSRGDLEKEGALAELAQQFGQALGNSRALRSAIGNNGKDGLPLMTCANTSEPHERGAVLVAAVFEAFTAIYKRRSTDLVRLATGGSGMLPPGAISHDLVDRLAREASRAASQVLTMCIRALDYCPPVDVTFGDFLRALITADRDLVPADSLGYRVSMIEAFRRRCIYPANVRNLSVEAVCWESPAVTIDLSSIVKQMSLTWDRKIDRARAYLLNKSNARAFHNGLSGPEGLNDADFKALGIYRQDTQLTLNGKTGKIGKLEVHSVRPARRTGPDYEQRIDLIVELTQKWIPDSDPSTFYRGGCTIVINPDTGVVRYCARKHVGNAGRVSAEQDYRMEAASDSLLANYFKPERAGGKEPFAMMHRGGGDA